MYNQRKYKYLIFILTMDTAIDVFRPVAYEHSRIEVSSGSARHPDDQSFGGARIKVGTRSQIG
jgi:hypothetical protein